jgi:hypothetical protein
VRALIRKIFSSSRGLPVDFAPIAAILLIELARYVLLSILYAIPFPSI